LVFYFHAFIQIISSMTTAPLTPVLLCLLFLMPVFVNYTVVIEWWNGQINWFIDPGVTERVKYVVLWFWSLLRCD